MTNELFTVIFKIIIVLHLSFYNKNMKIILVKTKLFSGKNVKYSINYD